MFPGDTQRLPICVPALPRVTAILHMLHLTLALCLTWTLTNKLLFFTFATESSFVIVTERSDHTMDSADASDLRDFLSNNNARMDRQEQMLATGRAVQALVAQVSELTTQFQHLRSPTAPPPPPVPPTSMNSRQHHKPRLPTPEAYGSEPNLCRAFLTKCSLFFSLQPVTFSTEEAKVALVLTLLSGCAALWGTAVWENKHPCCSSFHTLSEEMRRVFDRAVVGREAACMLADLRQEDKTFQIIPSSSGLWLLSVSGTRRRSGTCSCMGWLTGFRRRSSQWNYPLVLMDSSN